jgi:hypothetical protein
MILLAEKNKERQGINNVQFKVCDFEEIPLVYCNINVTLDQDIDVDTNGDNITDNDIDYYNCGGDEQYMWNVSYNKEQFNSSIWDIAKVHRARFTARDSRNNTAMQDVNITVFINEEEGDSISQLQEE